MPKTTASRSACESDLNMARTAAAVNFAFLLMSSGLLMNRRLHLILDGNGWIGARSRHRQLLLAQQLHVLPHAPFGLVETVFDGMSDARESFEFWREESEIVGLRRGLDDERIGQIDH